MGRYSAVILGSIVAVLAACGDDVQTIDLAEPTPTVVVPPPFERTEERAECSDYNPLRNAYFGETHVHTSLSMDAIVNGTRTLPRDAYAFALGSPVDLPPFDADGNPARVAQLRRPLDFTVVTDHAELFGEVDICTDPSLPGYDAAECGVLRGAIGTFAPGPGDATGAIVLFLRQYSFSLNPLHFAAVCGDDGERCRDRASLVWNTVREHAEEFYDRSAACRFTTFIGYEWTASTHLSQLHRNVVFRNADVPDLPISYVDEPLVEGLWAALREQCLDAAQGCDVLTIPHNSNLSQGYMFAPLNGAIGPFPGEPDPPPPMALTAADAAARAAIEPIVELTQHKGDSECRAGLLSNDELCGYEKMKRIDLAALLDPETLPELPFGPLSFVRNALKEGLVQDELLGVNPLRLGVIGSTDSHNGTPGATREDDYRHWGHLGTGDATPQTLLSELPLGGIEANPGGLAVVWAEENSRDALFTAMRRREVYATSGTRPVVRFFAGDYDDDLCDRADFVERGYAGGVPMGGVLGPGDVPADGPRFAVLALRDPGPENAPGTPLQLVQIVKGWVDQTGTAQEQVFDAAGDRDNGASVDLASCAPRGDGFDSLCTVWRDPEFDPAQRAFYYARVLENPTCRWSTMLCNDLGVDCSQPDSVPDEYETCCDPDIPRTIQERAWTSAIWYRPEGAELTRSSGQDS